MDEARKRPKINIDYLGGDSMDCLEVVSMDSLEGDSMKCYLDEARNHLKIHKKIYSVGGVNEGILLGHIMTLKHGIEFLQRFLEIFSPICYTPSFRDLATYTRDTLYSLRYLEKDESLFMKLEHAYDDLRGKMKKLIMKPGTDEYVMLFPEKYSQEFKSFRGSCTFLSEKIKKLLISNCKADQISPIMKELQDIKNFLTLLEPLFDYAHNSGRRVAKNEEEKRIFTTITSVLDRATRFIYLLFVGNLDDEMVLSLRDSLFDLIIEETEVIKMYLILDIEGIKNLELHIYMSLRLLGWNKMCYLSTEMGATLEDHFMSINRGLKFLVKILEISTDMDMNGVYGYLGVEMSDVIINKDITSVYSHYNFRGVNGFLLDKIATLVTSNCKADLVDPLKKELQDLQKMLTLLQPLGPYIECIKYWKAPDEVKILTSLLTFHRKATFLSYLSFVGKMDTEMVLSVKSNISTIKEIDVWEMYTMILNANFLYGRYLGKNLYVLENLILLLKKNVGAFNDACSKLYGLLNDVHIFLLGLSPNVLLRKRHLLETSFQAILGHSITIFSSCYLEHTEVDNSTEFNCVVDLSNYIQTEAKEMKLYYFPKVDDLGFLEFFSGYLEGLKKNKEISLKEEIDALHLEVHSLLSLSKVTNLEEINGTFWDHIINMAYQAEYIIDLYIASTSRDLGLTSSLSKIIEQLKNIRADMSGLYGKRLPGEDVAVTSKPHVLGTPAQVNDNDAMVGFQEEAKVIMEYLFMGENKLDVISIVGMAGVGKTTLALSIYNTPSMTDYFDILAWCTVSQSYQNRDLVLSILDQVNASDRSHRSISDNQDLADHLCRCLKKRRYLIVLDDIWDTNLWSYLKRYLRDYKVGSRIIITTRHKDVGEQIGNKVNELRGLSEEKSWELFHRKVFGKTSLSESLLKISRGIVEHCKGLPLSIVIIAGILSDIDRTEKKWDQIANSVSSLVLADPQGKCKAILELSYNHLPNHLRSCFLYMGLFPEDREISVNHLILLWIAEGLVRETKSDNVEEVAKKYMEDLIARSLVIPAMERSRGGIKTFRLHDLLHDFCLYKAKEKYFFSLLDKRNPPFQDPRRLIINYGAHMNDLDFSCHSIRSMICFKHLEASEIEKRIESYDMVLLKVLEVRYLSLVDFPNISDLVHLRYLALGVQSGKISVLPSSISKLQNLQFLMLRCEKHVIDVPDFIFDMVKLRHVHISPSALFEVDNNRLENSSVLLENLRFLSMAFVSLGKSTWLSKLSGLETLHCLLTNNDLEESDDLEEDDYFEKLRKLSFNGNLTSLKVKSESRRQRFICQLPISLRELSVSNFLLTSNAISKIGRALPHLEVFKLFSCSSPIGHQWNVGDEEFQRLKVLKLKHLEISKWIVSEDSFPNLEQLWAEYCHNLDEIPIEFGYLSKLRLIFVRECKPSVDDSTREIEKLQLDQQNNELRVHIYPRLW